MHLCRWVRHVPECGFVAASTGTFHGRALIGGDVRTVGGIPADVDRRSRALAAADAFGPVPAAAPPAAGPPRGFPSPEGYSSLSGTDRVA